VSPIDEGKEDGSENAPFWLSTGSAIVTAVARVDIPEDGVYSIEARYLSERPVRWNVDSCLRVITCPVVPAQAGRRRGLALELDKGEHEIEVTLGPGSKLDRIQVQRRDDSTDAYIGVVEAEGFKMGAAEDDVLRRDAVAAARRLRDRFVKFEAFRCEDELVAMEAKARSQWLASAAPNLDFGIAPPASAGATQIPFNEPIFPPASGDTPDVASPVVPGTRQ
jgi:hypothetical protein